MHDVSLAGAPARDDARARTTTAADDALSVRLDALQRAVDDALETFSTRLRNVKDAVSADANKATQLARASRRELEELFLPGQRPPGT